MGEPNELPEGGEGGGGIFGGIRGEWPQEMPVGPDYGVWQAILAEVSRLQLRIQVLEGAQLQQRVLGAAGGAQTRAMSFSGGPNELPEGGEGGGGGGFRVGGIRGEWPQEMPVYDIFAQLEQRLANVEQLLTERLSGIEAKLGSIAGPG